MSTDMPASWVAQLLRNATSEHRAATGHTTVATFGTDDAPRLVAYCGECDWRYGGDEQ